MKVAYIKTISFCIVLLLVGNRAMSQTCTFNPMLSPNFVQECPGVYAGTIAFQGSDPDVTYRWYNDEGPLETFTGGFLNTRSAYAGETYYVRAIFETGEPCSNYDSRNHQSPVHVTAKGKAPIFLTIDPVRSPMLCLGDQITLKASGGSGYSWSTGPADNGKTSITLSPTSNVTITLYGTESNCNLSATPKSQAITVGRPAGPVTMTGGPGRVCAGDTFSYTATSTNATSFQWGVSDPDAAHPISGMTSTVSIHWKKDFEGGTVTLSATANSETGCTAQPTASRQVQIRRKPGKPTLTPTTQSVLYNTTATITPSGALSGNTYRWYNSPVSTTPMQVVNNQVGPLFGAAAFTFYVGEYSPDSTTPCETDPADRASAVVNLFLNAPPEPDMTGCEETIAVFGAAPPLTTYYLQMTAGGTSFGMPIDNTYTVTTAGTNYFVRTNADGVNLWSPATPFTTSFNVREPFDLSGQDFCLGRLGGSVTLDGSQSTTHYQLYKESVPWGDPLPGGDPTLTWHGLSAGGRYSVLATKDGTTCSAKMNGEITIVKREPAKFKVLGGGTACNAGLLIRLDGSEYGVKYQLKHNGTNVGDPIDGHLDNSFVSWTGNSQPGKYTVTAFNASLPECTQEMDGAAIIQSGPMVAIAAKPYPCTYHLSPFIVELNDCGLKSFVWDLGDGETATTPEVFHEYEPGTYLIKLDITSVCNGVECTSRSQRQITVGPYEFENTPVQAKTFLLDKIINASALTFSDAWTLPTGQGIADNVNPFISGERGVWRSKSQYAYKATRAQSTPVNLATDGTFSMLAFNWEQSSLDAIPEWIKANTVTRYSPYGYELENKDVMNIYSSAVFDYSGQLISAEGANMRHNEMAFTGFETEVNSGNTGNWTFSTEAPQTFEVFAVITGDGHRAVVEAPDITRFDIGMVDVVAVNLNTSAFWFFGSEANVIRNDVIVCKTPHPNAQSPEPGKVLLVLEEAPFPGAWLGFVSIRKPASGTTATLDNSVAHTGASSLKITSTTEDSFPQRQLVLDKDKSYVVNAWVSVGNPNITTPLDSTIGIDVVLKDAKSSATVTKHFFVGGPVIEGWQQVTGIFSSGYDETEVDITFIRGAQGNEVSTLYVDDLRFHPNNGMMKSYVYDLKDYRLSAILDEQNFASLFYYDDEGNLTVTKKETERGIKTVSENVTHVKQRGN